MINIAIDFGASSGRVIKSTFDGEKIVFEDIHRFYNGIEEVSGHDCWNYSRLFNEVCIGLKKLSGEKIDSIGVDTWGVDFVLLDKNNNMIGLPVSYRDHRTDGKIEEFAKIMPLEKIYEKTGLQFMQFNTLYQLFALLQSDKNQIDKCDKILLVPDYFHFLLSGKKVNEWTQFSTTQLANAFNKSIDNEIITALGVDKNLFCEITQPSTIIGELSVELQNSCNLNSCSIILPPSHDTASAALATLVDDENSVFISSGTWSILGAKLNSPICTKEAMDNGYTNEGGADGKTLFMTNIMGMWLIQECMKLFPNKIDYTQLLKEVDLVKKDFAIIDVTDNRFLNPNNMIEEIKQYCKETNQNVPQTSGEIASVIFESLAECYKKAIKNFEKITSRKIDKINIVGGGCQNNFLNQETANRTGCTVYAGPIEATAIGNILAQLKALKAITSSEQEKEIIKKSFSINTFTPQNFK